MNARVCLYPFDFNLPFFLPSLSHVCVCSNWLVHRVVSLFVVCSVVCIINFVYFYIVAQIDLVGVGVTKGFYFEFFSISSPMDAND